jgi:hypothetical protein
MRGKAWIMINDKWTKISTGIESCHASPSVLVLIKSLDSLQMGNNLQVLAYGYDLEGSDLSIRICDDPNDDSVSISLNIAHSDQTKSVLTSMGSQCWCFFRLVYFFYYLLIRALPLCHPVLLPKVTTCNPGEVLTSTNQLTLQMDLQFRLSGQWEPGALRWRHAGPPIPMGILAAG